MWGEGSLNSIRLKLNTASELIVFSMKAWESECPKFYKSENICDNHGKEILSSVNEDFIENSSAISVQEITCEKNDTSITSNYYLFTSSR